MTDIQRCRRRLGQTAPGPKPTKPRLRLPGHVSVRSTEMPPIVNFTVDSSQPIPRTTLSPSTSATSNRAPAPVQSFSIYAPFRRLADKT